MDPVTKELIDGQAQLLADAKLGRLVRKMPIGAELMPGPQNSWWVDFGDVSHGPHHTPEQALEAAGIKDE